MTRRGRKAVMNIVPEYTARIVGDARLARPMKIVVDCGNGIPGASAPAILRALGCDVIDLYSQVDGDFPNHHPDPSKPENLADLIKVVHATGARRCEHLTSKITVAPLLRDSTSRASSINWRSG